MENKELLNNEILDNKKLEKVTGGHATDEPLPYDPNSFDRLGNFNGDGIIEEVKVTCPECGEKEYIIGIKSNNKIHVLCKTCRYEGYIN